MNGIRPKKDNIVFDIRRNKYCYIMLIPAMLYTIVFGYLTYPYIVIAFQKFNYMKGIFNSDFIGLKNFEFFFKSPSASNVTWNTIKLNFLFILVGSMVAVFFSLLLNEIKNKLFLKINQSLFLFPHFISWVVVSYIIYSLLSTEYGIVNNFLETLNLQPVNWYATPSPWTWILVLMRIWKETGMSVVIYLAAITGISNQIYEAAIIDGANRWQQAKSITIPLLLPTVAILTLLKLGRMFYADFGMIYSIIRDNSMLYPTTDVIDTYVFRALRHTGNPSMAMAVGLYQSFLGFLMVFGSNKLVKKYFKEGALF